MANIITGCRILLAIIMVFVPVFSPEFYGLYLAAGITDMIDGTIARKLGKESSFGAKMDTVADIVFVAVAAYKLLPEINLSMSIWIWIAVIAFVKVVNVISGFVVAKQFVAVHTIANKIVGFILFLFPLSLSVVDVKYSAVVICVAASFAAVQEGHFIRTGRHTE